jgi:NTP pyrophosphatase (non-canonical NTP hydrolase)
MEFRQYQQAALKTLRPTPPGVDPALVPLLGLAGEAGSVVSAYKKGLRDAPTRRLTKAELREELGDLLWYMAVVASQWELDLEDVAAANLTKITDRWRPTSPDLIPFDEGYPPSEQLPRHAELTFALEQDGKDRTVLVLRRDGRCVGDPLTDASHIEDSYRFHDIFHLAYVAVLGWSPVMRALLGCKRRSRPEIDEAEDGGRAIAIEEGVSALVFAYAARHNYLEGVQHLDQELLDTIGSLVAHLEVSAHRSADWERAILVGYKAWRHLRDNGGGAVELNMEQQTLAIVGTKP